MPDLPGIPKDFSLTGYMDPAFKYFAEQTKLPIDEISPIIGGELYGAGTELVCDMLMKGLLSKAVQTCIGIGTTAYSIWGDGLSPRLRRELLEYGSHEVFRIIDPKPSDLIEIAECIENITNGIKSNDIELIMQGLFRTPDELKEAFEKVIPKTASEEIEDEDEDEEEYEAIEEDELEEDIDEDIEESDEDDETFEAIES
ncbi:hypothetical protein ES703_68386 [subsurface metagenome]